MLVLGMLGLNIKPNGSCRIETRFRHEPDIINQDSARINIKKLICMLVLGMVDLNINLNGVPARRPF